MGSEEELNQHQLKNCTNVPDKHLTKQQGNSCLPSPVQVQAVKILAA
jgi:hypothetical protein